MRSEGCGAVGYVWHRYAEAAHRGEEPATNACAAALRRASARKAVTVNRVVLGVVFRYASERGWRLRSRRSGRLLSRPWLAAAVDVGVRSAAERRGESVELRPPAQPGVGLGAQSGGQLGDLRIARVADLGHGVDPRARAQRRGLHREAQSAQRLVHVLSALHSTAQHSAAQRRQEAHTATGLMSPASERATRSCCGVARPTSLMHAMMAVRELPPSAGCRMRVSLESR